MPNRFLLTAGNSVSGLTTTASLAGLVAGDSGLTLRRLETSFVRNSYSITHTFWGGFLIVLGGTVNNPMTPLAPIPLQQGNPVAPLALAYQEIGQSSPATIWSRFTEEAHSFSVEFEGANGLTVLPSETLAFYFTSFGGDSCDASVNIWFEE